MTNKIFKTILPTIYERKIKWYGTGSPCVFHTLLPSKTCIPTSEIIQLLAITIQIIFGSDARLKVIPVPNWGAKIYYDSSSESYLTPNDSYMGSLVHGWADVSHVKTYLTEERQAVLPNHTPLYILLEPTAIFMAPPNQPLGLGVSEFLTKPTCLWLLYFLTLAVRKVLGTLKRYSLVVDWSVLISESLITGFVCTLLAVTKPQPFILHNYASMMRNSAKGNFRIHCASYSVCNDTFRYVKKNAPEQYQQIMSNRASRPTAQTVGLDIQFFRRRLEIYVHRIDFDLVQYYKQRLEGTVYVSLADVIQPTMTVMYFRKGLNVTISSIHMEIIRREYQRMLNRKFFPPNINLRTEIFYRWEWRWPWGKTVKRYALSLQQLQTLLILSVGVISGPTLFLFSAECAFFKIRFHNLHFLENLSY